jgi:predicted Ser/Thr protein kinase
MEPSAPESAPLSPDEARTLEARLAEFDRSWDEKRLAAFLRELPPAGSPLRAALLVGLVKADLRQRWRRGRKTTVEAYLKACPELGTRDTVSSALLQAEYQARLECGAPADAAEFAHRFPRQGEELRQRVKQTLAGPGASVVETVPTAGTQPQAPGGGDGDPLPERFGRYRILERLGKGGMGTVYLAEDTQLGRRVALKVPHFAAADGPEVQRFYREARAAATIEHPHVCPVYDVGEQDGTPYLTMAFVEGTPLGNLIRGGKTVSQRQAAGVVRKLALALAEAHERGVVHRDLKPSNVMINQRGEPVVMDFGLARVAERGDVRLTQEGALLGTPGYMAPEQVRGEVEALGPACDVYSLGVMLYELLAGRLPFEGSLGSVLARVVSEEPAPPSAHRPGIDPALEAICAKAMAKKVADRYPSMRRLAADLHEYLRQGGPGGEPAAREDKPAVLPPKASPPPPPALEPEDEAPDTPARRPPRPQPRRRPGRRQGVPGWFWAVLGGAAVLLLLVAGVAVGLAVGLRGNPPADPGPPRDDRAGGGGPQQTPPTTPRGQPVPPGWQKFSSPAGRFSVLLPGAPSEETLNQETELGIVPTHNHTVLGGKTMYRVSYADFPGIVFEADQVDKALEGAQKGIVNGVPGCKVLRQQDITLAGNRGREVDIEVPNIQCLARVRAYLVGGRLYTVIMRVPDSTPSPPEMETFFGSFRLEPG